LRFSLNGKASNRRQTNGGKLVDLEVVRTNNGGNILINPLKGKMFPYFHNIAFKEPCHNPNKTKIAVDTGSSDFWIDSSVWCNCPKATTSKKLCKNITDQQAAGVSSSLEFADGFTARGSFINADLYFDQNKLKNIGFLAASDFDNRPVGINAMSGSIGLGWFGEQELRDKYGKTYLTLPLFLEREKDVTSSAYSMRFRLTASTEDFAATITFGGYDPDYVDGTLRTFQILNEPGIVISLDGISLAGKVIFSSCKETMRVMLDTGTFGMYLPPDTFEALAASIGPFDYAENYVRRIAIFQDCTKINLDQVLQFTFSNIKISLRLGDIVRFVKPEEVRDQSSPAQLITDVKKQCITYGKTISNQVDLNLQLPAGAATWSSWPYEASEKSDTSKFMLLGFSGGVKPKENIDRTAILGLTFLRHAFVLYDIPKQQVAMAPVKQPAVKSTGANQVMFNDAYPRKKLPGYNPTLAPPPSCLRPT
jgi:hypothetical protein